jgi:CheY-like chemotaxis protein
MAVSVESQEDWFKPDVAGKIKILAVEDNAMNQRLIGFMLKNLGFQFEISPNGHDAVERLYRNKFDLVLMDIELPLLNGYESTQKIRYDLKLSLPIIAMTAHDSIVEKEKCFAAGMNDYLAKPVQEQKLKNILFKYLNHFNQD